MKRMVMAIGLLLALMAVVVAGPNPVCTPGVSLYDDISYWQSEVDEQYIIIAEAEADVVYWQLLVVDEMATHGCTDPDECQVLRFLLIYLGFAQSGVQIAYEDLDIDMANRDAAIDSYKEHVAFTCIHGCTW